MEGKWNDEVFCNLPKETKCEKTLENRRTKL